MPSEMSWQLHRSGDNRSNFPHLEKDSWLSPIYLLLEEFLDQEASIKRRGGLAAAAWTILGGYSQGR